MHLALLCVAAAAVAAAALRFGRPGLQAITAPLPAPVKILAFVLLAGNPALGASDRPVIVVLGDSLVQGYGLPREDGLVPQLQAWLDAQGAGVRLVNAGVSGDTTAGGRARIGWALGQDVQGLILSLGANDALRGVDPAVTRDNLDAMLTTAEQKGVPVLLVGIIAPANYGQDFKARFEAIYPELAARHQTLLYPNFLAALSERADRNDTLARYYQPDALHPNADGVALIVADLGPHVVQLIERMRRRTRP